MVLALTYETGEQKNKKGFTVLRAARCDQQCKNYIAAFLRLIFSMRESPRDKLRF